MSQINNIGRKIAVAEMAPHVHSFLSGENKVNKISAWLIDWIKNSLKIKKIKPYDFLPPKNELAFHLGVSLGTIQNVYRIVEDAGVIESRQKVGAYIKNPDEKNIEKLTSKREVAVAKIKQYIFENNFQVGDALISMRELSSILGISFTTVRVAVIYLINTNILEKKDNTFIVKQVDYEVPSVQQKTLVNKIAKRIENYIQKNLKNGDKLPSGIALADMYNVSIKTIHDAIKSLSQKGIVKTKRGYYGTVVTSKDDDSLYFYEQVMLNIKKYITENCKVNDKLPTIKDFAEVFNVSKKTIKKALDILADEGYIIYYRGRYGGTYVTDIPEPDNTQGYAWLALSPDFEQIN